MSAIDMIARCQHHQHAEHAEDHGGALIELPTVPGARSGTEYMPETERFPEEEMGDPEARRTADFIMGAPPEGN